MATENSKVRVRPLNNWVGVIMTPRIITLVFLILCGIAIGWISWSVFPTKTIAWLSGMAAPFCTMCATIVWGSRGKLDDLIDLDSFNSDEYIKFSELNSEYRTRAMKWTALTLLYALLSAMPAIVEQMGADMLQFMPLISGAAVGASIYSYLLANSWDSQVRDYKNSKILGKLKKNESARFIKELEAAESESRISPVNVGKGWIDKGVISRDDKKF